MKTKHHSKDLTKQKATTTVKSTGKNAEYDYYCIEWSFVHLTHWIADLILRMCLFFEQMCTFGGVITQGN